MSLITLQHSRRIPAVLQIALLIIIQSCTSTSQIAPSDFGELGEIDSKEYTDFRIRLKDGTTYSSTNISVNDSTITIVTIPKSDMTKSNASISNRLPYSIPIGEVESLELRKASNVYVIIGVTFVIVVIAMAILANQQFSMGPN